MNEFGITFTMVFVPLTIAFVLLCTLYATIIVINNALSFYKAKQVQLFSLFLNKNFEGNHRKGLDRRQQYDRRYYHADRRQMITP